MYFDLYNNKSYSNKNKIIHIVYLTILLEHMYIVMQKSSNYKMG